MHQSKCGKSAQSSTMESYLLRSGEHREGHDSVFYSSRGFNDALILWIVSDNISFRGVKTPAFKQLLHIASISKGKAAKDCIGRRAASKNIRIRAIEAKEQLRQELRNNTSRVSISLDGWTLPNGYAFVGIVVHYIDNSYKLHRDVLDFKIIEGSHTGASYARLIWKVLEWYGLLEKVCDKIFQFCESELILSQDLCIHWGLSFF